MIANQLVKYLMAALLFLPLVLVSSWVDAQSAPTDREVSRYTGLLLAAHEGDLERISALVKSGEDLEQRDGSGRTPLIVAAFASHEASVEALAKAGADLDALEYRAYDAVTIAAVADDVPMLNLVLELGASAGNITSPYDGTALIAAAHLGHVEVVKRLIESGAPLDHINNIGWTAVIESIVLGDGGENHTETLRLLLEAGADRSIGDSDGVTPLAHAQERGFTPMIQLLTEKP